MNLTYFCDYDIHFKKSLKAHISETITATATLSCTVIQLGMVLGVDGICDLDLRKNVKMP